MKFYRREYILYIKFILLARDQMRAFERIISSILSPQTSVLLLAMKISSSAHVPHVFDNLRL